MKKPPPKDLADDQLDAVVGGWDAGFYSAASANAAGNGPSVVTTYSFSGINSFYVDSKGIGNGVSAGVSGGAFVSTGTAADYWAGDGHAMTADAGEGGHVSVEAGFAHEGFNVGAGVGGGVSAGGVGFSISETHGVDMNAPAMPDTSHAPGSSYDENGYTSGGVNQLAVDAGINDIGRPEQTDWSTAFGPNEGHNAANDVAPGASETHADPHADAENNAGASVGTSAGEHQDAAPEHATDGNTGYQGETGYTPDSHDAGAGTQAAPETHDTPTETNSGDQGETGYTPDSNNGSSDAYSGSDYYGGGYDSYDSGGYGGGDGGYGGDGGGE